MKKVSVLIVGGGPAGISASIWCSRLGVKHLLIEKSPNLGGQLDQIQNQIIDYPGFWGLTGQQLREQFITHFKQINSEYICNAKLKSIDMDKKIATISGKNQTVHISFQYIIFATGASPRMLGIKGEEEMIKRGEVYSASKDRDLFSNKKVVIIGGGDRAFEGALLLAESGAKVILIHRSKFFKARKEYLSPVLENPNITLLMDTKVIEITGSERTSGVWVKQKDESEYKIDTDAVFVRIGIQPNSEPIQTFVNTQSEGYVLTDDYGKTSHDCIYAIGDVCTLPEYTSISSSVGQGMTVAKRISLLLDS